MVFLVHTVFGSFQRLISATAARYWAGLQRSKKQILVNKNHRFCQIFTNFIHILPVYMVFLVHLWFFSKTYFSYGSQVQGWFAGVQEFLEEGGEETLGDPHLLGLLLLDDRDHLSQCLQAASCTSSSLYHYMTLELPGGGGGIVGHGMVHTTVQIIYLRKA
jgi:hypothetical protein